MNWNIKVPIFKNTLILKQLGFAIGIPFGTLAVLFILIKAYNGLVLLGATFLLAFLLVLLVFRGAYDVEYELNDKEVRCRSRKEQGKRVRRLSAAVFILGLLKGNLTASGIGLLAGSSTDMRLSWKRIKRAKFNDRHRIVMIRAGFGENIALFCTEDNYLDIKSYILDKVSK